MINPLDMTAGDVVKILNSSPVGEVTNTHRVRRDFERVGFRMASTVNSHNINFIKYLAWLFDDRFRERRVGRSYEERKEAERARNAEKSLSGRDIGDLPPVSNPELKQQCEKDFKLFCESYFPERFALAWSEDHLKVITRIEESVLHGGLFALAMSRGTGKSTLAECGALWAMLYGHREFVFLVGATETAALEMLDSIKTELEINEHLAGDFPEVCFPIAALDGISNRCAGQLYKGERTRITWTSNELVLPTIEGSRASGIVVRVAGITGRIRGAKYLRSDGRSVRPSLVIVDDPQTTESANSLEQTKKRVRVLAGDILGLAGPGQKISGIMPCTVIRPGDMADQILDRTLHPDWNGERTKMVYTMPKNMKLWDQYADIRAESLRTTGTIAEATEFYKQHRAAMDEGARVSWEARFNDDEISALQHAMNLRLQDDVAFMSEYQNDPYPDDMGMDEMLSVDEIAGKVNGLARKRVPLACEHVTAFIDVQKNLLYYAVVAWTEDFTGAVIDYGTWPEQSRRDFSLATADPTIPSKFPKAGIEGCIYGALKALTSSLLETEWEREDGALLKIGCAMVDANWGATTDVVYQFCRESGYSGILFPSHGRYIGASTQPMTEYRKHPGDRLGFNWMMPGIGGKRAIRHVVFDANFWKTFIHTRLGIALGDKGCLSFFGRKTMYHQRIAEHLTAEYPVKTVGRGRTVDEWKLKPEHGDNHWLDCLVGCAVCGSILGCTLPEFGAAMPARRKGHHEQLKLSAIASGRVFTPDNGSGRMKLSELRKSKG